MFNLKILFTQFQLALEAFFASFTVLNLNVIVLEHDVDKDSRE